MIITLSGTNRDGSNTRIVAQSIIKRLTNAGEKDARLLDLLDLKPDIFNNAAYGSKPQWFIDQFQKPVLEAAGMIVVTPEYNGSFPGVLKYFIDMLKFPESLVSLPVAFVGVAAGQFGALRSVEQLEMIFHYRKAHIFGERLFVAGAGDVIKPDGSLGEHDVRLEALVDGFMKFSKAIKSA